MNSIKEVKEAKIWFSILWILFVDQGVEIYYDYHESVMPGQCRMWICIPLILFLYRCLCHACVNIFTQLFWPFEAWDLYLHCCYHMRFNHTNLAYDLLATWSSKSSMLLLCILLHAFGEHWIILQFRWIC